ncbi:MAG: sulfotransferase, partial [Gammaproteobacteria bacterium]
YLVYDEACALGEQLSRLYRQVPRHRVFVVLMDDLKDNPALVYRNLLAFLGVDDDNRVDFPVLNSAKRIRSPKLGMLLRWLEHVKRAAGIRRSLGILGIFERKNRVYRARPPLSSDMRIKLQEHFRDDIFQLADLLERDLSHWL